MTTSIPSLYNLQTLSTEISKSDDAPCTSSIFDVHTSDDNKDFGNLSLDHSNEDDMFTVDVNVERELNKHFGLIPTHTGSTGSTRACTSSTASTSSTRACTSSTASTSSPANTSTDSACNNSTDSSYEVILLDPNIVFNPWGYRCVSNKAYDSKERKPVFKEGFCMGVWDNVKICYIDKTIDSENG